MAESAAEDEATCLSVSIALLDRGSRGRVPYADERHGQHYRVPGSGVSMEVGRRLIFPPLYRFCTKLRFA